MKPYHTSGGVRLYHGRAEEVLPALGERFTATVTDPPYGLGEVKDLPGLLRAWLLGGDGTQHAGPGGFMGKRWDALVPAPCVFERIFEAMLPGAPMLCFAGSRTQDLMGLSLRLAGFELRDCLMWLHGQGFPKSHNVGKALDRRRDDTADVIKVTAWIKEIRDDAGITNADIDAAFGFNGMAGHWTSQASQPAVPTIEQVPVLLEVLGSPDVPDDISHLLFHLNGRKGQPGEAWYRREVMGTSTNQQGVGWAQNGQAGYKPEYDVTAPATPEAALWEGYGTALAPAYEPVLYAVRPLDSTYAEGALENGVAGLNIDAGRIATGDNLNGGAYAKNGTPRNDGWGMQRGGGGQYSAPSGRWPANVLLGCACPDPARHLDGCAVAMLDAQTGVLSSGQPMGMKSGGQGFAYGHFNGGIPVTGVGDSGGASRFFKIIRPLEGERFFYTSKADKRDRGPGNSWPTVKPQLLVAYLCRLVTYPERNLLLDPFVGSGTTGVVAKRLSLPCVLIDSDEEACEIAARRLEATSVLPFPEAPAPEPQAVPLQASLFA